jgi:hypothetical protein
VTATRGEGFFASLRMTTRFVNRLLSVRLFEPHAPLSYQFPRGTIATSEH